MTAPTPSPLGWTLPALLRAWSERVREAAQDLPHAGRGYQVLREVILDPPPNQAALAARTGIDRTVMTYLLDALEGSGLLQRQPDPADRRARRIVATPLGRDTLAAIDARVQQAEDDLLGDLEEHERAALFSLLERAAGGLVPARDRCTEARTAADITAAGISATTERDHP